MKARTSGMFVGRARELGELEQALDATRAGTGATVLVVGEAGIGKTRLAAELAARARRGGLQVLLGRSIDLVGTELPYQPFAEALRPLGPPWRADRQAPGSQLRVFEETLALLTGCAAAAPVLLVLEDLHWADTSTIDLVVFLAHNLDSRPVLLLATYRPDEPAAAGRMRRLTEGVRRCGSALVIELGPLERGELTALLAAQAGHSLPAALTDAIAVRSEGNPFFAEELLAASGEHSAELPDGLRDLLLQRVARLDHQAQSVLRLAAAAGREAGYWLLHAASDLPDGALRDSLRAATEGGVLVAVPQTSSFRFRHALLAEAIYATILPGEREELHARLAGELARSGAAGAAELAPHWAAAGRTAQALAAAVEAARQAQAVFGLAEAHAHLERALTLWHRVPDAAELTGLDLTGLCASARPRRSASRCAPRGCARRRSWRRWHVPAGMPAPFATGSPGRTRSSRSLATRRRRRRPQRSCRMPGDGSPWPRPSTRGAAAQRSPSRGRGRQTAGSGSSGRPWRRTAAGVRPRRSSRPAPHAPRRPFRSRKRTPSRPGSEPGRCAGNSSCSPGAHGSTSRPRRPRPHRGSRARRRSSA